MKGKQIVGLIVLLVGIALILFAVSMKPMPMMQTQAVSKCHDECGKERKTEMVHHDKNKERTWALIGGIVLVVVGGGTMILARKKRRSR